MSCNCKNKNEVNIPFVNGESNKKREKLTTLIPLYLVKFLGFLVGMLLLPIIMGAVIVFMFKIIVLTREIDIRPLFNSMFKLMKTASEDDEEIDDDIEDDENDEVEYVMINVEDITKKD